MTPLKKKRAPSYSSSWLVVCDRIVCGNYRTDTKHLGQNSAFLGNSAPQSRHLRPDPLAGAGAVTEIGLTTDDGVGDA